MIDYFREIEIKMREIRGNIDVNEKKYNLCLYVKSTFNKDPYGFLSSCYMLFCESYNFGVTKRIYCSLYKTNNIPSDCNYCDSFDVYKFSYTGIPCLYDLLDSKSVLNYGIMV